MTFCFKSMSSFYFKRQYMDTVDFKHQYMDKINTLVFEGGGIYGYAYIGALKELQSRLEFSKFKYSGGSSAGALAYALALGLKSHQIEDVVNKFRTQLVLRLPGLAFKPPWNTLINYGLISNEIVRDIRY